VLIRYVVFLAEKEEKKAKEREEQQQQQPKKVLTSHTLYVGCSDITVICDHDMISILWGNMVYCVMWEMYRILFVSFV